MFAAATALAAACLVAQTLAQETPMTDKPKTEMATLGGGCFWCVEAVFERVPGVIAAVSGYAAGQTQNPNYKQVCAGDTGHAEVVQIEYDPSKISYEALLKIFWKAHDPTTLNQQGADKGTQYRSIILTHDDAQRATAEKSKAAASQDFADPIVTEIQPLTQFFPAEDYHQDYFAKNPNAPYCVYVIKPKLEKVKP